MEKIPNEKTVEPLKEQKALTAKEIKELVKPEFTANPENFYPVKTFEKIGFHRAQCPKCKQYYWRKTDKRDNCGDANCAEKYGFIGKGSGLGRKGKYLSYSDSWKNFEQALTSSRIPCKTIDRYPTVARWRADVDFCAAGIFCFQPYCVTGELDPPANPLICPQFCVRFNDLDNIGITGRHYSGFIMLGIQVFNRKDNFVFFKEECVEFNYRWLTEFLEIDPEEITFIEDVWCGGGNLGPSIEYFVGGLELGNMVFMEYKTFHDGRREKLEVQIIDVGIGLERVPWLINGTATSYMETFKNAFEYLCKKLDITVDMEIWDKFGPYSSMLNIDEVDDIEKTWDKVAQLVGVEKETIKQKVAPIKDIYVILDHTRTIFMTIYDGSLPSNVGGGGNIRNILRRVLAILHKNKWWGKVGLDELMEIIEHHKEDLERIYGKGHFNNQTSMRKIFELEIDKWLNTDKEQKEKLDKILKKKKGKLDLIDWKTAMQSWGIPADRISELSNLPIPGNLYYEISQDQERIIHLTEVILYDTNHLKPTECLYYSDHKLNIFQANVIEVFVNLEKSNLNLRNIVILDKSAFYPTSGGQLHDIGQMVIRGETYDVVNVEKVGACTLHILNKEVPENIIGETVTGIIDMKRRRQLMSHHTGTHVVFAAAKKILGPHVWQNGAKKTDEKAHLDITHFQSLSAEEEQMIENEANRIIMESHKINKFFLDKKEAELNYGFSLYQGGIVPGNSLRIVQIEDTDVEACCGTHLDSTSEVGWIKMGKSHRISDGIVRLEYVSYERALVELNEESKIINSLCREWGVTRDKIVQTGDRFFKEAKHGENRVRKLEEMVVDLHVKQTAYVNKSLFACQSDHENCSYYFSIFNENHAKTLEENQNGLIYYNRNFLFGLVSNKLGLQEKDFRELASRANEAYIEEKIKSRERQKKKKRKKEKENEKEAEENVKEEEEPEEVFTEKDKELKMKFASSIGKKKKVDNILYFSVIGHLSENVIEEFLTKNSVRKI